MNNITMWSPGMGVIISKHIAIDTETDLITENHITPKVVCLQVYAEENGEDVGHFVTYTDIPEYMLELAENNPTAHYYMHNAAFDLDVLADDGMYQALHENRLHCTYIMFAIYTATKMGHVSKMLDLASMCRILLGHKLVKDKNIRLTFTRDQEPSQAHIDYAMDDPKYTYRCAREMGWEMATDTLKTRSHVALVSFAKRGMFVDESQRLHLHNTFTGEIKEELGKLSLYGYFPKTTGVGLLQQKILAGIELDMGIHFPRTAKSNKIQTSKEALDGMGFIDHPFITSFKRHDYLNRLVSNYLDVHKIGSDGAAHTRFSLVSTGRTSSSSPNLQNVPRADGLRGMYIARPGTCYCASDYNQLELCGLGQYCLRAFGKSRLADTINAGIDCHKYMATMFTHKRIEDISKKERSLAKISNFGIKII